MKVWRVISLTLWTIVLAGLLIASSAYYLLSYTVLDQSRAKAALHQTRFYDVIRKDVLLPKVQEQIAAESTNGKVLTKADVLAAVDQVFTTDNIRSITDQVIGAVYQWSDNKTPNIEFSIQVAPEKAALAKALETKIQQNVNALPKCTAADTIPDNLADATCLPYYVPRDTVSTEAVSAMQARLQNVPDTLSPETLNLTTKDLRSAVNTPDYIGYIWTLNLITLPLALIVSLYLLLKRHGGGLIVIGVSLFLVGAIALSSYTALHKPNLAMTDNALDNEIIKASQLLVEPVLLLGGGAGVVAGIASVAGGIFWLRARRK